MRHCRFHRRESYNINTNMLQRKRVHPLIFDCHASLDGYIISITRVRERVTTLLYHIYKRVHPLSYT